MGYYFLVANCGSCKRRFTCNPHLVPSLNNIPFCKDCIDRANPQRIKNGLQPITYHPDAYGYATEGEA